MASELRKSYSLRKNSDTLDCKQGREYFILFQGCTSLLFRCFNALQKTFSVGLFNLIICSPNNANFKSQLLSISIYFQLSALLFMNWFAFYHYMHQMSNPAQPIMHSSTPIISFSFQFYNDSVLTLVFQHPLVLI